MVFSVSEERTVLWDKFEYQGSPEEFSWVLPVARGAYLEEASQAWFDALDSATDAVVTGPPLRCASDADAGCGSGVKKRGASSQEAGGSSFGGPSVRVVDRRTVGPYDVVTLRTESGSELFDWFDENGYFVPSDIAPIIEDYVDEGADFIAVKLRPSQGVQQMTPVRVVTPVGEGILPLRMVAAGVRDEVDIVLYVIGDARYAMPDLVEVSIDQRDLVWDYADATSNFARVRSAALSENGGYSFLTAYADSGVLANTDLRSMQTASGVSVQNIADLYFAQAAEYEGEPSNCRASASLALATSSRVVEDWESRDVPASGALVCAGHTDLAAALVGLEPSKAWLTRLELELPRHALSMDCIVEPHATQTRVDNDYQALQSSNRPSFCEQPVFTSGLGGVPRDPVSATAWLFSFAALFGVGRRLVQGREMTRR
jgi:hypothetical protein